LAKTLAEVLGVEFLRFDMSEYMERHAVSRLIGSPPGYIGFDKGGLLTEAIFKNPHAVLLFDEIEKAHPDIHNVLLQVMDRGTLTDSNGREADFRNVIFIMTTNLGAAELSQSGIGFQKSSSPQESIQATRALKRGFSPEFRNRLDAIIHFKNLEKSVILQIVDKFLKELSAKLSQKRVVMEVSQAAREFLAERGYDRVFGARPLGRLVQQEIAKPLADELLFGQLAGGGRVLVGLAKEKISFDYGLGDFDKAPVSEE
jgi:ATP-dependent Clp protease ATP-binding subunit ClpA